MLAVFLYHTTRLFDTEGWHLKNNDQSDIIFISMRALIWTWVMELFFLLSGVGTWYSLRSRSARSYIWERVKRLLIPLYTVGLFILLPIQLYFELFTNSSYRDSFWKFIPSYFSRVGFPRLSQWPDDLLPMPFSGHLWFLQYLFLISILSLPILLYLKSEPGKAWITRITAWSNKPGGIFLFIIPLALLLIIFRVLFESRFTWADLIWYAMFFIIGFMMAADSRLTDSVKKHGWICLVLWLIGFGAMGLLIQMFNYNPFPGAESFSLVFLIFQILWTITSWSAVVFMLSIGAKYLNSNQKFLDYGNEAVLPFYLFHQTIILCVGWYVIHWELGITIKLLIVITIAFTLIMTLYELLVRRFNIVRFLFGMRPKRQM